MASRAMLALAETTDLSDQRAEPRHRVLLSAKLVTTASEHPVKVRNLSVTGALIEGEKLPPAGTDVVIRRGAAELFAHVAWVEGGRCGVAFDAPLAADDPWFRGHAGEPARPAPPRQHRRPALRHSAPATPEEYAFAREWVTPRGRAAWLD